MTQITRLTCEGSKLKARLIGLLRIGNLSALHFKVLFYIADRDLHQDPAFPRCCLSKWTLQELFANVKVFMGWIYYVKVNF